MMKKNETPKKSKCFTKLMDIKGVELFDAKFTFTQESDTCDSGDFGQSLTVFTEDGGGGSYIVISTERWAIDYDEIDNFCDCLKRILKVVDEK